jgi:hypothetical protein
MTMMVFAYLSVVALETLDGNDRFWTVSAGVFALLSGIVFLFGCLMPLAATLLQQMVGKVGHDHLSEFSPILKAFLIKNRHQERKDE